MKRKVFFAVAMVMSMAAWAQNIAVVSPSNSTDIYNTLDEAITNATPGSTIYLPGGGFVISDDTSIDKKLTIMGVSHRGDADNVDGATIISGRLNFVGGSSGSAVVGVYVTGEIRVGTSEVAVNNFTLRYCNVNYVKVYNSGSMGMLVNQCYLRNKSDFSYCNVHLENCIVHLIDNINGGIVNHNVVISSDYDRFDCSSSSITNNFFLSGDASYRGEDCYISNNCLGTNSWDLDQNPVVAPEGTNLWDDVFGPDHNKGVTIASDYHVIASWAKGAASDGTDIGIYGGSGFSDNTSLAPIPRIVSKSVDEQSDASGKLTVTVKVKSN
ncbi:MAG: hypothetical protein IKT00_14435 [Prevotella sp.]|nr:hypothetical protein [Prevotella sp.]